MSKSLRVSALLLVCLSLIALPAFAGQADDKAPSFSMSVGVPTSQPFTEQDLPGQPLDITHMTVLLDGIPLPGKPEAKSLRGLFLFVDKDQGVIHAFRTREELEAHAKANGALGGCNTPTKAAAAFCSFWSGLNCNTGNAVFIACGNAIGNIVALLGGPIQSFQPGCNTTFLFPNATCTGTGIAFPGTAPCINVSVPNPFNCVGCF
ncbi:MAG TPA: hypothetical protein VF173_11335 [Thermoanaerobaculia bacterium]|nr:hypothetical protein [Thermoanaerobaculia bacterium]